MRLSPQGMSNESLYDSRVSSKLTTKGNLQNGSSESIRNNNTNTVLLNSAINAQTVNVHGNERDYNRYWVESTGAQNVRESTFANSLHLGRGVKSHDSNGNMTTNSDDRVPTDLLPHHNIL